MNYLAHLRLSRPDAESMTGNLMGDFRKYLNGQSLPRNVQLGIENHMRVDKFTDSNPQISELKKVFSSKRRRFAGIIIDVCFDHFLSQHWHRYSDESLDDFIERSHENILLQRDIMPNRMQYVVELMVKDAWLKSYANLAGIDEVLNRMSQRIRFENNLFGAIEEIREHYEQLEQCFLDFFPELLAHVEAH